MIKVEIIDVWGFKHAIRGMRNPMNSWNKSDSFSCSNYSSECVKERCSECNVAAYPNRYSDYVLGYNDLNLMKKLYEAGTEHRKYLRQIFVSMNIVAPLYWWKEMDTYKVGVSCNSCSTMHKIHSKPFSLEDFSCEHLSESSLHCMTYLINQLNNCRESYNDTKDKEQWYNLIQLLPSSYNQMRTVTMDYENVVSMIKQRTGHKLDEWNKFVEVLSNLPYIKEITNE